MIDQFRTLDGEGYRRIFMVSRRDARLYRWTENTCMIAFIGAFIAFDSCLFVLLQDWLRDSGRAWSTYVRLIVFLPAPFVMLYAIGAFLHRRVGRRYGLL